MEVMVNPSFGIKWNPSIRKVVLRHQRRVSRSAVLPNVFTEKVVRSRSAAHRLLHGKDDTFDVTAQVSEMPLPRLVQRVTGPRYSADFIAARFDCKARAGFTLATSLGTEALASAAGVSKGQELCLTATLAAPVEGNAINGTQFHIVTHFDPQVPIKPLRRAVKIGVGRTLKKLVHAIYRKALVAQRDKKQPYVGCH
uniref:START domain-containing protein n=1 Tax=Alexandrium andersonii TaxID=327968 RepID=A0A7S2AJZ6_9DINO